jgi:SagB-type dehydrogenase family enzyme
MKVTLNAAVRLIPPSSVCDHWIAENLLERRRFRLSVDAAAMLVASCLPDGRGRLVERLAGNDGQRRAQQFWVDLAATLYKNNLIVDVSSRETDPRLAWLIRLRQSWSRYGWHEAAEYHLLTYDYPCLDYTDGARAIAQDQGVMRQFQAREPDSDRVKLDYLDRPGIDLPAPSRDMPTGTISSLWTVGDVNVLDFPRLATILSLTFGRTGTRIPRTNSAPLLRRSSPSGGGRHPSEGYLVVHDVPGIAPGWYHITMEPFSLRMMDGPGTDEASLAATFPETVPRVPYQLRALVVLTSVFERNMYRYREPRTFRTVHMDAGHLAGTLRMTARSLGVTAGIFYCDDAERIEKALSLDGMREGYMLTVALSDGVSPESEPAAAPGADDGN